LTGALLLAIDKQGLLATLVAALEANHQQAHKAALQAYQTATDEENVAENKYDTLGLEASYLAQGQARRMAQCEQDLGLYQQLQLPLIDSDSPIKIGSLVLIEQPDNSLQTMFVGPSAGGLSFVFDGREVVVVTPKSPMGKLLLGSYLDDRLSAQIGGVQKHYQIIGHI
jgi:transcription elongation GreA/GreB family factor